MRATRTPAGALLAGALLFGTMGTAAADTSSASPGAADGDTGPTEAGTGFRSATPLQQGQGAVASASTGDYLYWVFPAEAEQRVTVTATVTLPASGTRHGASAWQLDAYDGLRRRQACTQGEQTRAVPEDSASVELSCTLRTVRAWAEPWDDDPLPGRYYVRLTVVDLPEEDLGLPFEAAVEATSVDAGGAYAVDGSLAPLAPGTAAEPSQEEQTAPPEGTAAGRPEDGWSSGRWSDRWIWTVAAGVLGGFAAIAGYSTARRSRTISR